MVSVKLLLFFVAVAVTVVVPSAGTRDLFTSMSDTRGIVVRVLLADVDIVPSDTPVTNFAEQVTVLDPLDLCVTVFDLVARSCLDVDVLNCAENV